MKKYLNSLNERERWMVIASIICVVAYVYYLFLYTPLSNRVTEQSAQLIEKRDTLAWMKKVREQSHSTTQKETLNNGQLLSLLATQLKNNQALKFPYQLQQTGTGDIQLTFDAVPFQMLMTWLIKINQQYAITIKQFDVDRTDTPGVTKLMIIMTAE